MTVPDLGRRHQIVAGVVAVLALTAVVSAAAIGPTAADRPQHPSVGMDDRAAQTTDAITITHTFERLPDQTGRVQVTVETGAPESVTGITLQPPDGASVVETDGYEETDDGWLWDRDEAGDEPTLTYVVAVNRTSDGMLEATSTGEWALFNWRHVDTSWSYTHTAGSPESTVVERGEPAGEGVVGPGYAYLGPYETETRTVDEETIRVIVPEMADMEASPATVADALAGASDTLRVAGRNDRLNVFVAPAPIGATGRLSGAETDGEQDMYIGADEPMRTADNAWFHEYVHSRQSYEPGPGMGWFDEGTTEYYAALLAYEGNHVSAAGFYDYVRTDRASDAVLRDPESLNGTASYFKGMRVLAALDAELRDATDGNRTLQDVFRAVNTHNGTVDEETFAGMVAETAGESRDEWLATYVGTDASPAVPDYLGRSTPTEGSQGLLDETLLVGVALLVGALAVQALSLVRRRRD